MKLIDDMMAEHELIEQVLGALRNYTDKRCTADSPEDEATLAHAAAFGRFFVHYAGTFHHAREEDVLFAALVKEAELPADKGPIHALQVQHEAMAAILADLMKLLGAPLADEAARQQAGALALQYSHDLWRHIDAENSVLFPEAQERLLRVGVPELPSRALSAEEEAARQEGQALLELFPPLDDGDAVRGEGCVVCPSFGVDCLGIERSWWSDSEWDELHDRVSH